MQKTCFYRGFEFFKENSLIKKSVEQSQNKECKNVMCVYFGLYEYSLHF